MLDTLMDRKQTVVEWIKIPWNDPEFSQRMLREHLSQDHDAASRRFDIIDQHVAWMHNTVLQAKSSTILDLGCGPGFYTERLTKLGHICTGLDISPASITYAKQNHAGTYSQSDIRTCEYGADYDMVSLIFGELNAFATAEAQQIIAKAYAALKPDGKLLLEVTPYHVIESIGQNPPTWHTAKSGLFAAEPYLCLEESRFESDQSISHFYVIDAASGALTQYTAMHQAYTEDEYRAMLCQFADVVFYPSLNGDTETSQHFVIVATKS